MSLASYISSTSSSLISSQSEHVGSMMSGEVDIVESEAVNDIDTDNEGRETTMGMSLTDSEDDEDEHNRGDDDIDDNESECMSASSDEQATLKRLFTSPDRGGNDLNGVNGDDAMSDGDESYHPMMSDDESDDDGSDDSALIPGRASRRGAIMHWLASHQRRGTSPQHVLQRLLDAFPAHHTAIPSELLWSTCFRMGMFLTQALLRRRTRRRKLPNVNTLDDVVTCIKQARRIVVLTGAGISVAAGIPDFRSRGGIYRRLKEEFGMPEPECMFDLAYFTQNPQIFYSFAHELWPGNHNPTLAHRFIAAIEKQGKLLRNYTQNIDALEYEAGINNVLQCHGSFATASCMTCKTTLNGMDIHTQIMSRRIAYCQQCHPEQDENGVPRTLPSKPRSLSEGADPIAAEDDPVNAPTYGVLKPDIVFFGESLPAKFDASVRDDREHADLVLVMGSSLKVHPVAGMISAFPPHVPIVLINREVVGKPDEFDVELLGDCDAICNVLAQRLEWTLPPPTKSNAQSLRPLSHNSVSNDNTATSVASATSLHSTPASITVLETIVDSPLPSSILSPTFVHPNRYLFPGAQVPSTTTPALSAWATNAPVVTTEMKELTESIADSLNPDASMAAAAARATSAPTASSTSAPNLMSIPLSSPPLPPRATPSPLLKARRIAPTLILEMKEPPSSPHSSCRATPTSSPHSSAVTSPSAAHRYCVHGHGRGVHKRRASEDVGVVGLVLNGECDGGITALTLPRRSISVDEPATKKNRTMTSGNTPIAKCDTPSSSPAHSCGESHVWPTNQDVPPAAAAAP